MSRQGELNPQAQKYVHQMLLNLMNDCIRTINAPAWKVWITDAKKMEMVRALEEGSKDDEACLVSTSLLAKSLDGPGRRYAVQGLRRMWPRVIQVLINALEAVPPPFEPGDLDGEQLLEHPSVVIGSHRDMAAFAIQDFEEARSSADAQASEIATMVVQNPQIAAGFALWAKKWRA